MSALLHAGEYWCLPALLTQFIHSAMLLHDLSLCFLSNELVWQAELTSIFCRLPMKLCVDIWRVFLIDSRLEAAVFTCQGVRSEIESFVGESGWWRGWKSTACKVKMEQT